ncbi:MAG: glycoside hydrolase family 25 protein [Lachnospiraceae bacterium]|nr:glycoside hydrolase family 25 protein [Lachnospiraceae bacterium]
MNSSPAGKDRPVKSGRGARRAGNMVAIIFLSVIALVALSFCAFLLLRIEVMQGDEEKLREGVDKLERIETEGYITEADAALMIENERARAEKETTGRILTWIKDQFAEGSSTAWVLRNLYGTFSDELVVSSGGSFYFFPRNDSYKQAIVQPSELKLDENGRMLYRGADPSVSGALGVDVSRFQGRINWDKVAADGVSFAFIRAGARGSSEGKLIEDAQFEANVKGALDAGLDVGVYFYTQAISEEEAIEEADYVIDVLAPFEITLPVVFDFEQSDSDDARTNEQSIEQNTANVLAFCNRVQEAGYQPMLYGNIKAFLMMLDMDQLEHIKKWYAFYDEMPYFPYEYSYWQYSDKGHVDGIEGNVDLDICIEDLAR